jgi:hypothetical protein
METSSLASAKNHSSREFKVLLLLIRVNLTQYWRKLKAIRSQSLLMSSLTVLFLCGYIISAFFLFYKGIGFVGKFPGFGNLLFERYYFAVRNLFILLLFSNIIISYTNFFKNRERNFFYISQFIRKRF